jgi:osmoprotectant transport system permease protein
VTLDYLINRRDRVWELTLQHINLSATAILIALLFAIPLGVLAARNVRISTPMLGILGAIYTIPSLAFLALLIPSLGIGRRPAIVVLAAYAQIFLVRNIATGLRGVDPATLEAALGLGMTRWQQFARVRWPLALPVIIAGLRTA